jgi:predicted DNA-binding transcriptional regulator YafY
MNWGIKQRQEFIEYRLFWEGSINRKDLVDNFGVSVPQASADMKKYKQSAPNNIYYDKSQKRYLINSKFKPIFGAINAHDYLTKLSMLSKGVIKKEQAFIGYIPEYSMVPSFDRAIDPNILKKILKALKIGKSIYIYYQSMTRSSPVWRWISPHAFAFDGFRWHVRAYCELSEEFRDFVLGRILETKNIKNSAVSPSQDYKWNRFFTLQIGAHPDLSPDQRKVIEKEFNMKNGILDIKVRAAFVYYVIIKFSIAYDKSLSFPKNKSLTLLNYKEIQEYI